MSTLILTAQAYAEYLQKKGTNAVAGLIGKPHDEALYIFDSFNIQWPISLLDTNQFEKIILVDASDLNGLEGKTDPTKVIEIIDHRKICEVEKFPNAKTQIELVGAAATLIAEKFIKDNLEISRKTAILLYGAIISNTLNFKGTVTTPRDIEAAKWANQFAKLSDTFWKKLFTAKSDQLKARIEDDLAWFIMGGKKIGIAQIEMIGAEKLVREREEEIIDALEKLKTDMNLDFIFQNTIDLERCQNIFIASNEKLKKILEEILGIKFDGMMAKREILIMRKQIVPLLKQKFKA